MNVHEHTLRSLDAAALEPTAGQRERAGATLERIVASDPSVAAGPTTPVRHRDRRRLVAVAAAGIALVVAAVVVTQKLGDDQDAYASWTTTPGTVSGDELDAAAAACRDQLAGTGRIDMDRARLMLAERRGDHVTLLFHTDVPDASGACLVHEPPGSTDVDDVRGAVGGTDEPSRPAPATGYTQSTVAQFPGASLTDGAAGAQVTAVTVHVGAYTARATVRDGRYVAWWPGPAFSHRGNTALPITYDLTLADGTVHHDVPPSHPASR